MPVSTSRGLVEVFDDFDADHIGTAAGNGITWFNSSDASDTAFDVGARPGGTARGATTTTDDNLIELSHGILMWRPQDGQCGMETRVNIDVITNVACNIGFNDDALDDSNTLPAELATATWTSNAATFCGLVFDVDATNDDWHAFWVDDDNDASNTLADLRFTGAAWGAARYDMFRVEMFDQESGNPIRATFHIGTAAGTYFHKERVTNVDRDALLTPYIGMENRSGTAHQLDVDYIHVWMSRGTGLS